MAKKKTSINIDQELWKYVRKHCIDKEVDISDYLESLIRKDLKK